MAVYLAITTFIALIVAFCWIFEDPKKMPTRLPDGQVNTNIQHITQTAIIANIESIIIKINLSKEETKNEK